MDDLEQTIADLVERKRAALVDSAEWRLANQGLIALRYSCAGAGDIIEDVDPDWGTTFRRPAVASPSTEQRQVLPFRKRSQQKQDSEELKEREQRKLDPRRQAWCAR
jgi:hypothetical protein